MRGVQIAVMAMIAVAVQRIGKHVLVDRWLWGIGLLAFAATVAGVSFWIVLTVAGFSYLFARSGNAAAAFALVVAGALAGWLALNLGSETEVTAQGVGAATLPAMFYTGLKGGLLTFGGAYTAIPFVRDDAVGKGWVSDGQFLDGLALSGIVPAPLVIFVTFVGYLAAGLAGALAITLGMFLPAFAFTLIFYDRLEALVEYPRLHQILEGIAAAVVGIIAATALELALHLAGRVPSLPFGIGLFAAAAAIIWFVTSRYTALWLLPMAGVVGWTLLR